MNRADPPPRLSRARWLAGDPSHRAQADAVVARLERGGEGVEWLRRREARHRLARVRSDDGRSCFVKHYLASDRHPWREWWKRSLRLGTAEREWRALTHLRAAGISVPKPLAHAQLASGEHVIVTEWVDGTPLAEALAERTARPALLAAVGALVRDLHAAGWVHRDLHRENILVAESGPVLIDLQAARRARGAAVRRRDLGRLDHSLRRLLSIADRVRLRAAALGARRPFDPPCRADLRAIGRASLARAHTHALSRARRSLRAGRRARTFEAGGGRGLVSRAFDAEAVRALFAAPAAADRDHKGFELRRFAACGGTSAARRAWRTAYALEASDVACAEPVAFLEWFRFGVPRDSALALAVGEPAPACDLARCVDAQIDLWVRLHEAGFGIASLDPAGLGFAQRGNRIEARVTALESVRFPARTSRSQRAADLARLDGEWQRRGVPEPLRARARARYRRRLPISPRR